MTYFSRFLVTREKLQKFLQHISQTHTYTYFAYPIDFFCLTNFEKNTNLSGMVSLWYESRGRPIYSLRKSELFPSAKRCLPNPSPTSKLQVPPNQRRKKSIFPSFFFFFLMMLCVVLCVCHKSKCLLGLTGGV